jgi:hypothetical protein
MLATENRTRSRIKRILAIALPVVRRQIRTIRVHGAILVALLCLVVSGFSQTTVSTGGIQGTVTDPSGALVTGAIVSITNTATGQTASVNTSSSGAYTFAFLKPAGYVVRIEARSFKTTRLPITVKVDQTANGNATLVVGDSSETVDVSASDLQVNTIQATVQGILTSTQIANLPVNGRNFLDLAQLEPGVQIQDGQNFDPTKAGYSSISFGGRFGRTARVEVDGADVSDETVGTTTTDIPSSAIQEFQISQSSLDMSTELTSSGSVNVTTKSGTNNYHGEAFGQFRDSSLGALLPTPPAISAPYQRSQYGGDLGGPIFKDKLFFFADGERTIQHTNAPVPVSVPFSQYSGTFSDPFHEGNLLGRVDYQWGRGVHFFYRFSYFNNSLDATSGAGYSLYDTKNNTRDHVIGVDFKTGNFIHSIRFSFLKFQNQIVDATAGDGALPLNNLGVQIIMGSTGLAAGPNFLAPQTTAQSDHELKYDGTKIAGSHVIRYGVAFNQIQGAVFAPLLKYGPQIVSTVSTSEVAAAAGGPFPRGASNPLNYPADSITITNGLGYFTSEPALGFQAGGLGPDNRVLTYLGDSWKIKPNFNLTYGLRWDRDTGRTDSQYVGLPELNALLPGLDLGNRVSQPNFNFAPQLGFAWDPWKDGKTVVRGGIGLFYENAIWNNVVFDAPNREPTGAFEQFPSACSAPGTPAKIPIPGGFLAPSSGTPTSVCGTSIGASLIGNAMPAIVALQQTYQADSPLNLQAPNPSYVGQYLTDCSTGGPNCFFTPGVSMFNPNYKSPRSVQMNIGVQRQLKAGVVLSIDYIRNVQTHYLLGIDENHAGDIRYFNKTGALDAIAATNTKFGCAPTPGAGVDCAISGINHGGVGATISDYAGFGLGSSSDMGGSSCIAALGYPCAFGGVNPQAPPLNFLSPVGRSVYNGLETKLATNLNRPFRGSRTLNVQVSYALSRFENTGGATSPNGALGPGKADQDYIIPALDNRNPNRYFGPSTLDRTHQLSFGGYLDLPGGFQVGLMSHFYSPLSTTLTVPNTAKGAGEIFRTDFTGDGTTQDPVPGTHVGEFDRGINAGSINRVSGHYNNSVAGNPTPAGQALIQEGLMTSPQLTALGAVAPALPEAPANQVNLGWLRVFDTTLSWTYSFHERVTVKPSVGFYNLFNFANFDLPTSMMSGLLTGTAGTINGTDPLAHNTNRVGVGTGVFALGSPREIEFSLKITY